MLLTLVFMASSVALAYTFELVPKPPQVEAAGIPSPKGGDSFHFFLLGNRYGFVDPNGSVPIVPQFKKAENFDSFGLAKVQGDGGWGLINDRGEFTILPLLDDILIFDASGSPSVWGLYKNWWGRLTETGKWQGHPQFNKVEYLDKGLFAVYVKGKAALMDASGKLLTQYLFDGLGKFTDDEFGRSLSLITSGGKLGVLDKSGKVLMEPTFESLKCEFDKNGHQIKSQNGLYGVLDISGKWIIEPKFNSVEYNALDPNDDSKKYWVKETNLSSSYFYYTLTGEKKEAIPQAQILASIAKLPQKLIGCFQEDNDKLFGYCDEKGAFVIKPEYDYVGAFGPNGLARVKKAAKFGYINTKGEKIIDFLFDDARDFTDSGVAMVLSGKLWGLIDAKGTYLLKPSLDAVPKPIDDKLYFASVNKKYGILSSTGTWLLEPDLDDFQAFRESGMAWVKKGELWGEVDKSGKWVKDPTYEDIGIYTAKGLAPAYWQGHFAVVNEKGDMVAHAMKACGDNVVVDSKDKVSYPPKQRDCKP
jgi:hypothetical protein